MYIASVNKPVRQIQISPADLDRLSAHEWRVYEFGKGYLYALTQVRGKRVYMHRLIVGVEGLHVDHINGDTLDNRRENLRAVTPAENARNRHSRRASVTGIQGVYEQRGRYTAKSSKAGGGRVYLGMYATAEEAKAALDAYEATIPDSEAVPDLLRRIAALEAENAELRAQVAA